MTGSTLNHPPKVPSPRDCLGRTCLKWTADGELTTLDLSLVLQRLARVDQEVSTITETTGESLTCISIS